MEATIRRRSDSHGRSSPRAHKWRRRRRGPAFAALSGCLGFLRSSWLWAILAGIGTAADWYRGIRNPPAFQRVGDKFDDGLFYRFGVTQPRAPRFTATRCHARPRRIAFRAMAR